jgi:hemerythrin-like domain-containing protein
LFKAMMKYGMPQEGSPVAAMLHEHEIARGYTRALRAAAECLKSGDLTARSEVIYYARRYAALLRNHIAMEDQIVFPMADQLIPPEQHQAIWERIEMEMEGGGEYLHKRYLALACALEKELEVSDAVHQ